MIALFDASAPGNVPATTEKSSVGQDPAIDITGLRFSWGISSAPVLDIDSLHLEKGQRMFIEGPSGSGKSTLLGLLAGIVTPQAGRVSVLGRSLEEMSGAAGSLSGRSHGDNLPDVQPDPIPDGHRECDPIVLLFPSPFGEGQPQR